MVFIGMPLLTAYLAGYDMPLRYYVRMYVMAFYDVITFYIAYFFIKPYVIFKGNKINLLLILLFIFMQVIIRIASTLTVYYFVGIQLQRTMVSVGVFIEESFDAFLFTTFAVFLRMSIEWVLSEKQKAELLAQSKSSELALLRSQVNPHFLFNTLNNIYSLVCRKSDDAPQAVMKLSEIMRYMLYDTNADKVSLNNEINYLRSYIELQELRLNKKDFIKFEILGDTANKTIAPMLLIPFIENAFKHGSKKVDSPGIIIKIKVDNEKIFFETINYIRKNDEVKDAEGGIGLHNIERRLDLIYPGNHKLEINNNNDIYSVKVEIGL